MPLIFIKKHFVIWPRLACKPASKLLKEFSGLFTMKSLAQVKLWDDRITSCGYLRFAFTFSTSCGFLRVGFLTSCALNFLRINRNFTSFYRLRVLAAQELLAPLLARALFLGCNCSFTTHFSMEFCMELWLCLLNGISNDSANVKGNVIIIHL